MVRFSSVAAEAGDGLRVVVVVSRVRSVVDDWRKDLRDGGGDGVWMSVVVEGRAVLGKHDVGVVGLLRKADVTVWSISADVIIRSVIMV